MNLPVPRFLRALYRKEPISSFIVLVGAVDMVMGGVGERWSLFSLGLVVTLLAVALRWWQGQKKQEIVAEHKPRRYLPPSSSRQPLPMLTQERRRS
jgi:hypothetical protein